MGQVARPLGPSESLLVFADLASSLNFTMTARLTGPLDEAALTAALAAVQERHPLLRNHIEKRGRRYHFVDGAPPIPLRRVEGDPDDWIAAAEAELHALLPLSGPFAKAAWLDGGDRHTLLITFHHVISDAMSGAWLTRDILQAAASPEPAVPASTTTALAVLPAQPILEQLLPAKLRGIRGILSYLALARRLLRRFRAGGKPHLPGTAPAMDMAVRRSRVHPVVLPPEQTRALAARARAESTTVHGALVAALLLALTELPDAPERFHVICGSPTDDRKRLRPPVGEDVGFFISMAISTHVLSADLDFWDLARDARAQIVDFIDRGDNLTAAAGRAAFLRPLMWLLGKRPDGPERLARIAVSMQPPATGLTNIGRVPIPSDYGPLRLDTLGFVVSPSVLGDLVTTAACVNDTLCWNLCVMEPAVTAETANRIRDAARARLIRALD